jgi:choloylglycine hydrolase
MRSMARIVGTLVLVLSGLLWATTAFPCTTFVLQGGGRIYFGRNLDWDWENGLVIVNPRNVNKSAIVAPGHSPAKWTSKYGSVTFNQFGRDKPFGGMNEVGLVVEQMMLFESQYPPADLRPEIDMLQWIQYQLDNCRTVADVIATDAKIRLEQPTVPARIHYLVCDARGDCATIEFLGGKMVCRQGQNLPYRVLANDTYEQSVAFVRAHPAPEGISEGLKDPQSLSRFSCAATRVTRFRSVAPEQDREYVFETLEQVRQGKATVWQIVYDVSGRQIHYRTRTNPQQRMVDLKVFDFSCSRPVQFVDIHTKPSATGALEFQELSETRHRKYLEEFLGQESLKQAMGDLMPTIEKQLQTLRGYTCADR